MPVERGSGYVSGSSRDNATTLKSNVRTLNTAPPPAWVRPEGLNEPDPTPSAPVTAPARSLASPAPLPPLNFGGVTAGVTTSSPPPPATPGKTPAVGSSPATTPISQMAQSTGNWILDTIRNIVGTQTQAPSVLDKPMPYMSAKEANKPMPSISGKNDLINPDLINRAQTDVFGQSVNAGVMTQDNFLKAAGANAQAQLKANQALARQVPNITTAVGPTAITAESAMRDMLLAGGAGNAPPIATGVQPAQIKAVMDQVSGTDLSQGAGNRQVAIGSFRGSVGSLVGNMLIGSAEDALSGALFAQKNGLASISENELLAISKLYKEKFGTSMPMGSYIPVDMRNPQFADGGLFVSLDTTTQSPILSSDFTQAGLIEMANEIQAAMGASPVATYEQAQAVWQNYYKYPAPTDAGVWFVVDESILNSLYDEVLGITEPPATAPADAGGDGSGYGSSYGSSYGYGGGGGGGGYSSPAPVAPVEGTGGGWEDGYSVEGAPNWWVGLVNTSGVSDPQSEYAMMLNSMIPSLSPEDQRYVATFLASNFPDIFTMYKDIAFAAPPFEITSQLRDFYTSSDRARQIIESLNKMRQASGLSEAEFGPGYSYLNRLADVMAQYGGGPVGSNDRQTNRQYSQMLSGLDPLLAESKGDELSAYGSIAERLTTPFFSAGKLVPVYKDENNQWVFGQPNSSFASM